MWQSRASKDEAGAIPMAASESAESETRMTSGWDKMGLGKSVVGIGAHESTYFGVKKKYHQLPIYKAIHTVDG